MLLSNDFITRVKLALLSGQAEGGLDWVRPDRRESLVKEAWRQAVGLGWMSSSELEN